MRSDNVELKQAIEILKDYIKLDRSIRESPNDRSDYDKFCEEKCIAIEMVLEEVMSEKHLNEIQTKQLQIINYYGFENQLNQLIEECGELIVAIAKLKRYGFTEDSVACAYTLVGELADVKNIIEQLELKNKIVAEGIGRTKEYKVDRELDRIKG